MTDNVSDSILVYRLCFTIFWMFVFIFSMCEFGEMVTNQFDAFNDAIGNCKWYLLRMEMKRMIIILMAYHQRPITIHGRGNILCTRIAFKKVNIDRIFSNFPKSEFQKLRNVDTETHLKLAF